MNGLDHIQSASRDQAQRQWNANPCGAVPADEFDSVFFERVEAERYRQQYWQRRWFDYGSFDGQAVLEIGVGLGTDLKQFARAGARCHGADITDRHLELTKLNFDLEGYPVDLHKADATALPFPDNYFDCVYSFGVLHHIPDVSRVLAEIHRVLKPGGMLQTAVYHRYSLATGTLLFRSLFNGSLFRLGLEGVLARIETGADGLDIKPYVKLYSRPEWRQLVEQAGFTTKLAAVRQIRFEGAKVLNSLRPLETLIGWYVCGKFVKAQ
jgi:ubiquinone/menaquinone biosynthesis C-methylase UbiE